MRFAGLLVVVLGAAGAGGLVGCNDPVSVRADAGYKDAATDAAPPPWWRPKPGTAKNWDVQLAAPFDVSMPRTMYLLNLWDVVPAATVMDHGDGSPITVPAGVLAGALSELHARRPRTVVICQVGTGGIALADPDAAKFPGFAATPPDDPTPPEAASVVGWNVAGDPAVRWLDIRPTARATVMPLIAKRFELAAQIGCDGIAGDYNDQRASTGFTTTASPDLGIDIGSWFTELAAQGHMRELSMGMKDGYDLTGLTDEIKDDYDWMLAKRCGEYGICLDYVQPFLAVEKAVLALDFDTSEAGDPQNTAVTCGAQHAANVYDGIVKNVAMTGAVRDTCNP